VVVIERFVVRLEGSAPHEPVYWILMARQGRRYIQGTSQVCLDGLSDQRGQRHSSAGRAEHQIPIGLFG